MKDICNIIELQGKGLELSTEGSLKAVLLWTWHWKVSCDISRKWADARDNKDKRTNEQRTIKNKATRGHIDVYDPRYHPRQWERPWSVLPPKTTLIFIGCATTQGHADMGGLCSHLGPCGCLWPGCGLCCHLRPCWYPWVRKLLRSKLVPVVPVTLEAMMISLSSAVTGDQAKVLGICWYWRPCGCSWFMLWQCMQKPMICAPDDC